jgi:phosphoglycolate phosphatase-like HAD superfamily hydrolase
MISLEAIVKIIDMPASIWDLDMTLIDASARYRIAMESLGFPPEKPLRELTSRERSAFWDVFLSERYLGLDRPFRDRVEALRNRYMSGMAIIILTGRPIRLEKPTRDQLRKFNIPHHLLIMRPEGVYEPEHKFKIRVLERLILEYGVRVEEVHDDNQEVIAAVARRFPYVKRFHYPTYP